MNASIGKFVWYELATSDRAGAEAFYRSVVGWEFKDAGMPGQAYTLFSAGPVMVGGMYAPSGECGEELKPGWMGYVEVPDVDGYVERVRQAGGTLQHPPTDIPEVGRFAIVADPYGAAFVLIQGLGDMGPVTAPGATPGRIGWHELHAGDGEGAFTFYAKLFGWTLADAMDMGPMGAYRIFAIDGTPAGGMMTRTPDTPRSFWLFYLNVDALDAAMERCRRGGGKVLLGPEQVPGGSWVVHALDPQGAMFAMVAPSR
jgi:hypothetical protein